MDNRATPHLTGKSREQIAAGLLILALALLQVWPAPLRPTWWLWKPGSPVSDLAVTHWPNAHFAQRILWKEKAFPLWRPGIMSGTPLAANPLGALYYPLNWLLLFLPSAFAGTTGRFAFPLIVGFNLSALIHLALAGATMYALMRHGLAVGFWAGLVAAVAYQASPKLLAHLGAGHVGWVQAWAWLPLVVLCTLKACQPAGGPTSGWAIGAGCGLAIQFCADVRMSAYTLVAVASMVLAQTLSQLHRRRRSATDPKDGPGLSIAGTTRSVALLLATFAGLSACQWLPALALLPQTTRSAMALSDAAVWSLPWRYLGGLILADHGGFHEWMIYVGVSTLVLASSGGRTLWRDRRRRWMAAWLVGLGAFALWFSLGKHGGLFQVLWCTVPGLKLLRVPPRAWVLATFTLAVLAGLGSAEVTGPPRHRSAASGRWQQALVLGVAAFPPLFVLGYLLTFGAPRLNLAMFGLITPLTIVLCSARQGPGVLAPSSASWLGIGAVLLVSLDLLVVGFTLVEVRPSEDVFAEGRAAAEWLAGQPGGFRVYSPSYSIPQHVAERYDLELADGVDPFQLQAYADYLTRAAGLQHAQRYSVTLPPFPEGSDVRTALADVVPDTQMLGQLGVRYVAAAFPIVHSRLHLVRRYDDVFVYRNEDARPPAGGALDPRVVLANGTELFRYRTWAVHAGWVLSGLSLMGVAGSLWWICRRPAEG